LNNCPIKPCGVQLARPDLAARLADPRQFARRLVLVGGEHYAEGGDDDVKGGIGERQRLGIGLAELDGEVLGGGALATAFEQGRHIVGGHDIAPAPRGGERDIAVAGGDIEHAAAGPEIERFAKLFADDLQRGSDHGIVAGRPRALLALLDGGQIRLCFDCFGCGCGGHAISSGFGTSGP
jgi:hypothetical protein